MTIEDLSFATNMATLTLTVAGFVVAASERNWLAIGAIAFSWCWMFKVHLLGGF